MVVAAVVVVALIAGVAWSAFQQRGEGTAAIDRPESTPEQRQTVVQTPTPTQEPEPAARSYRVEVPEGWREIGEQSEGDRLYLAKVEGGVYAAVVTVETTQRAILPLERLPDVALRELIARNANPTPVGEPSRTAVDGQRAISFSIRLDGEREPLMERQVAFHRDEQLFLITFASAPETFKREAPAFERFLKSWKWK